MASILSCHPIELPPLDSADPLSILYIAMKGLLSTGCSTRFSALSGKRFLVPLLAGALVNTAIIMLSAPALAQSIGPLKETWDGGKTWVPEGTGRSSQPAYTAPSAADIARQQEEAAETQRRNDADASNAKGLEAQKRGDLQEAERLFEEALAKQDNPDIRQNLADNANRRGIAAQQQGNYQAALEAFEKALANWDHPVIRENIEATRRQIAEQNRIDKEYRDAPTVQKMHAHMLNLEKQLPGTAAKWNPDGGPGPSTATDSGLDFEGLPGNKPPAEAVAVPAGKSPESSAGKEAAAAPAVNVNSDPMVVDLSGAKSLVVDPARVAGGLPPAGAAQPVDRVPPERLDDVRAALSAGDPDSMVKANEHLRDALNADLRQTGEKENEAHLDMLDDMQTLRANGQKYADALKAAQARIREKEIAALGEIDKEFIREFNADQARIKQGGKFDEKKAEETLGRLRHAQAAVLRDGYDEMAKEVTRLLEELMKDKDGKIITAPGWRDEKVFEDWVLSLSPSSRPKEAGK